MPKNVEDLIQLFELQQVGDLSFRGPQPITELQRLFGGQVLAQTLVAAMKTVPSSRAVHSLNAYFLQPGSPHEPLRFKVEVLRDGRSFSARRVTARQQDSLIFELMASFQEPETGLSHSASLPLDVIPVEQAIPMHEVLRERFGFQRALLAEWDALDVRLATEAQIQPAGGTMRVWVRTQGELPADPQLHAAVLAYLSDLTLLSVASVPHEVQFLSPGVQAASIDHAMWFHRPVRADQWLLYDMVSPSASGAKGFCQGQLFQHGQAVASCAQEGLIRLLPKPK